MPHTKFLLSNRNNTAADATELHAAADHQPYDTLVSDTHATQLHEPREKQPNSSDKLSLTRILAPNVELSSAPASYGIFP